MRLVKAEIAGSTQLAIRQPVVPMMLILSVLPLHSQFGGQLRHVAVAQHDERVWTG